MHDFARYTSAMKLVGTLVLLLASTPWLSGETYLSEAQAVKIAIPRAASVTSEVNPLTAVQRESLQRKSDLHFTETAYKCFIGRDKDGKLAGYAVVINEIGKEEYITFIVGVTPTGTADDVAVMEYRETRGEEVREQRFLRQFRGKKLSDPITVDRDIVNYTGATLSSHAIARGVKKALALIDVFYFQPSPSRP